jgi:hypothetical protein
VLSKCVDEEEQEKTKFDDGGRRLNNGQVTGVWNTVEYSLISHCSAIRY